MPAVLSFDLGKQLGFGLVGRGRPSSGSFEIVPQHKPWRPLGPNMLKLEDRMHALILQFRPDILACATPFVRKSPGKMYDTSQNLVPMFGAYTVLHMLAAAISLKLETIEESDARSKLVGKNMLMRKSEAPKRDVIRACLDRGWPVTDDHAADALCVASAILERISPGREYETTPLFQATPTMRQRRRKAA